MASWIVHLRIADNLLQLIPGLIPAPFAVGNIAPDSGIPDEKWEKFVPSPKLTHFQVMRDGWNNAADLDFYRGFLLPIAGGADQPMISFRLGYFCHLITDNLWGKNIGLPTMKRWAKQFAADKDFIWVVKKDWYGLDFIYLRDHPDCIFWHLFLTIQGETGGLDFLPLEAVKQRVKHIQQYYQRKDEEIQKAFQKGYIYLTPSEMDRFVDESTQRFFRIYQQLWINGTDPDGLSSALDLVL